MRRKRKNQTAIAAIVGNSIICGAVISGFGDGWVQPVGALPAPVSASPRPAAPGKSGYDCRQFRSAAETRAALANLRATEMHYQRMKSLAEEGAVSQSAVLQAQADYQKALERFQDNGDRSELKARLALAKRDYERMQLLYNEGAITRSQMLQTQQTYQRLLNEYQQVTALACDRSK